MLYNRQILTVDNSFTIAEAVAIRDGTVLVLGSSKRLRAMVQEDRMQGLGTVCPTRDQSKCTIGPSRANVLFLDYSALNCQKSNQYF